MYSGDQQKPYSLWNRGPETEPQVRLMYHGLGTPHTLAYTSNPVSWLIDACHCIPFLKLNTADQGAPVDTAIADQLSGYEFQPGDLPDTGSVFFSGDTGSPLPGGVVSPRSAQAQAPTITGFAPSGVPLGVMNTAPTPGGQTVGGAVPLWGSRKTLGLGG